MLVIQRAIKSLVFVIICTKMLVIQRAAVAAQISNHFYNFQYMPKWAIESPRMKTKLDPTMIVSVIKNNEVIVFDKMQVLGISEYEDDDPLSIYLRGQNGSMTIILQNHENRNLSIEQQERGKRIYDAVYTLYDESVKFVFYDYNFRKEWNEYVGIENNNDPVKIFFTPYYRGMF